MHLLPYFAVISLSCVVLLFGWLAFFSSSPALWPRMWLPVAEELRFICWRKPSRILFKPEFMCSTVSWCGKPCVRVCVWGGWGGLCRVLDWLGHVVELSWSPPPPLRHEVDYYLPFLKYSKDAECVLSLSARKIMNMQKKQSQTRYQLKR